MTWHIPHGRAADVDGAPGISTAGADPDTVNQTSARVAKRALRYVLVSVLFASGCARYEPKPLAPEQTLEDVEAQEVQACIAHLVREEYARKSIDHIHDVLSAVLRTASKWGHLEENPARGVDLPKLCTVRPKWALTTAQAAALLEALALLPGRMVGLAILSGLRRGEVFALRWRDVDEAARVLTVREAVYDGRFSTPKTEAAVRQVPLSATALSLVRTWRCERTVEPGELMFSTRSGAPIAPNNVQ